MGDWIDSIIARADKNSAEYQAKIAEHNSAVKTALAELDYLERLLSDSGSQAQFLIAQRTFMNVQAKVMRLQLEAMLKQ